MAQLGFQNLPRQPCLERRSMNIEQEAIRLRQLWATLFREFNSVTPIQSQFYIWLTSYPPIVIEQAIHATFKKTFYMFKENHTMGSQHQINYAEKVMKIKTQESVAAEFKEFGITYEPSVRNVGRNVEDAASSSSGDASSTSSDVLRNVGRNVEGNVETQDETLQLTLHRPVSTHDPNNLEDIVLPEDNCPPNPPPNRPANPPVKRRKMTGFELLERVS